MKMNEPKAIAVTKEPLNSLFYREVVVNIRGEYYLENVNVLFGNKILTKIRFKPGEKPYKKGMGKEVVEHYLDQLFDEVFKGSKSQEKKSRQKKTRVNESAKQKAAGTILKDLGL